MQEDKWCVLERFRVREAWRDRVLSERPELFPTFISRHMHLMEVAACALGPFLISSDDSDSNSGWLSMAWEFSDRQAASELLALWEDPEFVECLEVRFEQGHKHEPNGGLPGF